MKNMLRSLFGGGDRRPPPPDFDAPLAPDAPFVAVGDLHGRVDLLDRLVGKLEGEAPDLPWVFVGDYVDRGPDSAGVLARLRALQAERANPVVCLKGNHEKMMRDFLDDPLGRGQRWLRFGGIDTLRSFGIDPGRKTPDDDRLIDLSEAFEDALPDGLVAWLDALPLQWQSGNIAVAHAAMDPDTPPAQQEDRTLLWGSRGFFERAREDGIWVVHGHTIVSHAERVGGRIAVDTGAYKTGRLTAARIAPGECTFLTA